MGQRGGKRPGAGRKVGSVTKVTAQARRKALESGISPLEYMLKVMRSTKADTRRRDDMAKAAAPFIHNRPSVSATVNINTPRSVARIEDSMPVDQAASLYLAALNDPNMLALAAPVDGGDRAEPVQLSELN
jgi:hypothetical protein